MGTDAIFHPWRHEIALGVRNRVVRALRQWPQTLFVAAAWAVLAGLAAFAFSRVDGDRIGIMLGSLLQHPLPLGVVLAALVAGATGAAISATRQLLALGWWAAMPIPPGATRRTLAAVGVGLGAALAAVLLAALLLLALVSDHPEHWLAPGIGLVLASSVIGVALGLLAMRERRAKRGAAAVAPPRGMPLYAAARLDRGPLPHVAHWQRVAALRSWRAGGGAWQFLLLGLAIPANESRMALAGLILFGLAAIWGGVAARACMDVIARLSGLLVPTPTRFADLAAATVRYPVVIFVATSCWAVLGLAMQQAGPAFLIGFPVLLAALLLHRLALAWRHGADARRARIRYGAELALVAVLMQATLVPMALLAWAALVGWTMRQAGRTP